MSTVNAIKGGMAYVQAYLDDNPVTQGLTKLRAKLISWQSSLGSLGSKAYGGQLPEPLGAIARFAASPAGIFSGMIAAAKHTATAREEMLRLAETSGLAVEKFSALAYAGSKVGVSSETLASNLRRMQSKEFQALLGVGGKGGKGVGGMMAGLGISAGMDPGEQLRVLAQRFEKLDAASRIGLAKKLGVTELLPLLSQGVAGLDALTARAKELGLVASREDAEAGKKFTLAWGDLSAVLDSSVKQVGGALIPMITGVTNLIVRVAVAVRDLIKDHKALTMGIFMATAAIVAGGIALKGISVLAGLAATAVAGLRTVFSVVMAPISAVAGLVGGALSTGVSLLCKGFSLLGDLLGGAFRAAVFGVETAFKVLGTVMTSGISITTSVVSGIVSAIATLGPLALALAPLAAIGAVLLAGRGVNALRTASDGAGSALARTGAIAKETFTGIKLQAAPAASAIMGCWDSVRTFAVGVAGQAGAIFSRLWSDLKTGFANVVGDVTGCMDAITGAVTRGDLKGAWTVTLELLKLEWLRFKNWFLDIWESDLLPKVTDAIPKVAAGFGSIFADLKISWQGMWNEFLVGLKGFLGQVDSALDSINATIVMVRAAANALPGAMNDVRDRAGRKYLAGIGQTTTQNLSSDQLTAWQNAMDEAEQKARNQSEKYTTSNLAGGISGIKTQDELDAAGKAARAQGAEFGKRAAAAIMPALGTPRTEIEKNNDEAAILIQKKAWQDAVADLDKANAAAVAAKTEKPSGVGKDFAAGQATVTGTFSGAVASMLAGGGSVAEQQLDAAKDLVARADQWLETARQQLQAQQRTNDTIRDLLAVA